MAGIGSAVLGELADRTSIEYVFQLCAFLPLIGLLTVFLPNVEPGELVAVIPSTAEGSAALPQRSRRQGPSTSSASTLLRTG